MSREEVIDMNIMFFDLINDGHHFFYNYNVMKINGFGKKYYISSNVSEEKKTELDKLGVRFLDVKINKSNNKILNIIKNILIIFKIDKISKNKDIDRIMILYLDSIILPMYVFYTLFNTRTKVIATLHWYPNRNSKLNMLKKICKKNAKLIVHTNEIKEKLYKEGIVNVQVINYPTLNSLEISKDEAKEKVQVNNGVKTLLYFGGTRYDKGIDILMDALKIVKSKINIIIAGQEQHFKKEFIEENIAEIKDKNIVLKLEYISDEYMQLLFKASDIVVLPYRKMFKGESGILTEAINNKNIVVLPNIIHFGDVISKYKNGLLYEAEDVKDFACKIDYAIQDYELYEKGVCEAYKCYKNEHSIENFIKTYEKAII